MASESITIELHQLPSCSTSIAMTIASLRAAFNGLQVHLRICTGLNRGHACIPKVYMAKQMPYNTYCTIEQPTPSLSVTSSLTNALTMHGQTFWISVINALSQTPGRENNVYYVYTTHAIGWPNCFGHLFQVN